MAQDFEAAFVRQRRSLILISLIIPVVVGFGLRGTELRVGPGGGTGLIVDLLDVRYIYWGMYGLWAWFLIRYLQHLGQVTANARRHLLDAQIARISTIFEERLLVAGEAAIVRSLKKEFTKGKDFQLIGVRGPQDVKRQGWAKVTGQIVAEAASAEGENGRRTGIRGQGVIAECAGPRIWWPLLRAVLPVNVKHPYFTEYRLPLVVAMLPILVLISRWHVVS